MGFLTVSLCNTSAQTSRGPIQVFGGQPDERASTRLLYETDRAVGEFAIDYGRPAWKKERTRRFLLNDVGKSKPFSTA